MRRQGFWVAVLDRELYEAERLYANETLAVESIDDMPVDSAPQPGDPVALVAIASAAIPGETTTGERLLFGLGVITAGQGYPRLRYTHRLFDEPLPVEVPLPAESAADPAGWAGGSAGSSAGGLLALAEADFARLTAGVGVQHRVDRDRSEWFVSVALPIEAASRAEAVREFWSYVDKLGPRELPAFVWPRGDELAMQAYLLGEETNLDPESDD